jgi:hypothetical protein
VASNYPGSLDSFDTIASDKKTSDAVGGRTHRAMHNDLGDAIESVQTELGTNPSGSDATVAARLSAIEAGTNLATGAVTSAKIADGTIVATDVAASTFAAFGTVGNLLTANQASGTDTLGDTNGFTVHNAATITSDLVPYSGTRSIKAVATGNAGMTFGLPGSTVTATVGQTYTAEVTTAATDAAASELILAFYDSGGTWIGQASKAYTGGGWRTVQITGVAPASTAAVSAYIYQATTTAGVSTVYADCWGIWKGAGGKWQLPGVPIPGQSEIAVNDAVNLSGTGTPEGVVTATPGSTWLQTDATTDVKGWIRWVKATGTGNTGWQAGAEADTGWRNVSAGLINSWGAEGSVLIRRTGSRVVARFIDLRGASSFSQCYSLPSGFAADGTFSGLARESYLTGKGVLINMSASSLLTTQGLIVDGTAWSSGHGIAGSLAWNADPTTWPTSLPGSPA